jgi:hypothetical protein
MYIDFDRQCLVETSLPTPYWVYVELLEGNRHNTDSMLG